MDPATPTNVKDVTEEVECLFIFAREVAISPKLKSFMFVGLEFHKNVENLALMMEVGGNT